MIVIQLSGGLGNQMFQYALYEKLLKEGRDVSIDDVTAFPEDNSWNTAGVSQRRPMLDLFGIKYCRADKERIIQLTDSDMRLTSRVRRKLTGRRSLEKHDEDLIFAPSFLSAEEGYFSGCFQSDKYFEGIGDDLKKKFGSDIILSRRKESQSADNPENTVLIALHMRFGDYLNNPDQYGGICTDAYYRSAICLIGQKAEEAGFHPVFCIFSNDHSLSAAWIKENWQLTPYKKEDFRICGGGNDDEPLDDYFSMAACTHHIIANSSFSWWASYVGKTDSQIVCAPSIWLRKSDGSELDRSDIYRDDMILINPEGTVLGSLDEKNEDILISVIIPAYNVEKYIRRSVSSLCNQTYRNMEIIVVDDGSSDQTGKIADDIAEKDPRVRVVHQKNGGVSAARNRGLDEARGEYIGFMDSDDAADPQMYEIMLDSCLRSSAPLAAIPYLEISDPLAGAEPAANEASGPLNPVSPSAVKRIVLSKRRALDAYASENEEILICNSVWNKLFRKDIVENLRFEKNRESEDIVFTTKALLKAEKTVYIMRPMYFYTVDRGTSIMNAHIGRRRIDDEIPFWKEQRERITEAGFRETADLAYYNFCRHMLYYNLDFRRTPGMEEFAAELEEEMQRQKEEICALYKNGFIKTGDRARMSLFLKSPAMYEKAARLYDKFIHLRQTFHK